MQRLFTGWHMTAIIVAFFGIVIAVNVAMATFAIRTFSGTVVDNSYVASQQFNSWLAASRAQRALGWSVKIGLDPARHVRIAANVPADALLTAIAVHPLGRVSDQSLGFDATGDGGFVSRTTLPAGRFMVHLKVHAAGHEADFATAVDP